MTPRAWTLRRRTDLHHRATAARRPSAATRRHTISAREFDEHSLAADDWQAGQQSAADAGLAQLDIAQSKSPPSSLSTTMSTVGFMTQRSFFLKQNLAKMASKKVVLAFDLFVAVLENEDAGVSEADCLVAGIDDGMYGNAIRVANIAGLLRINVEESITSPTSPAYYEPTYAFGGSSFAVGAWHHFELTADRQTNTLGLRVDKIVGAPPASTPFHVPSGTSRALALSLGAQTDSSGETIKVYFDNVTVDVDR